VADTDAKARTTVVSSWDDRALMQAEADRTGDNLSATILRLAKLGLEHQARTAGEAAMSSRGDAPGLSAPMPLLTAGTSAAGSTAVVPVAEPGATVPAPVRQPAPEPAPARANPSFRRQAAPRHWTAAEAPAPVPPGEKARWAAVGVLSLLLGGMLIPGNGMAAAAVSQTVLGHPGDGVAASNRLFEQFSHRAGPLRYLEATGRLADNRARIRACADRADRFADHRDLTVCELHLPSRRRAVEVGQGILDR